MKDKNEDFYRAFEEKYRGSRDLIKARLKFYIPFVEPILDYYQDGTAIDLGCGRGEWLEILQEYGFTPVGVDTNDGMLEACRQLGLVVKHWDAVEALKSLQEESQILVTGFHIAEHLAFDNLQTLIKESFRVLKPGGVLILETPNPENIVVGTSSFYLDPTHVKPLPPGLLSFLPEYYGFINVKVLRLQESEDIISKKDIKLRDVLEGVSPDYSIIAQKHSEKQLIPNEIFQKEYGVSLKTLSSRYDQRTEEHTAETEIWHSETEALVKHAEARALELEARYNEAEARTKDAEANGLDLESRLKEAEARAKHADARASKAEARSLEAQVQARLAEADLKMLEASRDNRFFPTPLVSPSSLSQTPDNDPPNRRNVFYDAGLILHFGFNSPVGIVRVEQYVAEFLAKESLLNVHFVHFDQRIGAFRALTPSEQTRLNDILFHRYGLQHTVREESSAVDNLGIVVMPSAEVVVDVPAQPRRGVFGRILTSLSISRDMFNKIIARDLAKLLPIRPDHAPMQRVVSRITRRSLMGIARTVHLILLVLGTPVRAGFRLASYLSRIDAVPSDSPVVEVQQHDKALSCSNNPPEISSDMTSEFHFAPGDTIITIANTWDYMDYSYLTRIVKGGNVRLISVIYDVIAMEMPFTTPAPVHIYHRHWVELGHLATHLVAISKYSLESYRRLIAEPNDLDPLISYAYLPNFLYERRDEIGKTVVPELLNRRFVVFCSTIETRKNHQLLLHLWERLRQVIDSETLPILVFVGGWGWGTETVRLLSERNWRLRDHLQILNKVSDAQLIWLYHNARFTVFPALSEGFGLAAAESLSFGTPVVVANCPALIEASEGLMPAYDPLDLPSWMAEMRRLILDDDYLESLRKKAAQYKGAKYNDFANAIRDAVLADDGQIVGYSCQGEETCA